MYELSAFKPYEYQNLKHLALYETSKFPLWK